MKIFFGGASAQEHPGTGLLLRPGMNEVPDDRGAELLRIAEACGAAAFPVRTPTKAEETAYADAIRAEEAAQRAAAAALEATAEAPPAEPEAPSHTSALDPPAATADIPVAPEAAPSRGKSRG